MPIHGRLQFQEPIGHPARTRRAARDLSIVTGVYRPGEAVVLPARSALSRKPEFRVFF